jgi:tripartite ATP-independent transporter DctM subunit
MLTPLISSLLLAMAIGVPIAFALGIAGTIGLIVLDPSTLVLVPQRIFSGVDSFPLMAVPFFVLAGELMGTTGILKRLLALAETLVGHFRGGLAHVNVAGSMVFAGISGSAIADASALGSALIPSMAQRYKNRNFAAAVCASAATIGPIIPPSIPMVVYAFVVGKISIGALFLAGVVPGIVIGLGMMAIIYVIAHRRNYETERTRAPLAEVLLRAREAFWALLMPAIILGGIVFGVFTATEAAAIAVMYSLIVGFLITRELHVIHVIIALRRAVIISAVVFLLVGMSNVVSFLLSASMAPIAVAEWIKSISDNPLVFLLVVNLILLALGCFLDNLAIMIMAAPVLAPVAASFGIDPLHFGFVFVLNSVIGMLTPPVGAILFTVCGVSRTSIESVTRELWPFLLWQLAVLALVTYVPAVSLALPKLAGY